MNVSCYGLCPTINISLWSHPCNVSCWDLRPYNFLLWSSLHHLPCCGLPTLNLVMIVSTTPMLTPPWIPIELSSWTFYCVLPCDIVVSSMTSLPCLRRAPCLHVMWQWSNLRVGLQVFLSLDLFSCFFLLLRFGSVTPMRSARSQTTGLFHSTW